MTIQASYGLIAHTNSATFQAWVTELHNLIAATGLTQTADTGQTNPATIVYTATANTSQGYEIWAFNDTLQATAPLYVKFEYGTGQTSATPGVWITIGTGTNGAGTITGTVFARISSTTTVSVGFPVASTTTSYLSQATYNAVTGLFALMYKQNAVLNNGAPSAPTDLIDCVITRTCDSAGNPTATGVNVYWGVRNTAGSNSIIELTYNFSTSYNNAGSTSNSNPHGAYVPYDIANTIRNGQVQLFKYYSVMPDVAPLLNVCVCLQNEVSAGATFTATVFSTPHTYLSHAFGNRFATINGLATYNMCILWE